MTSVLDKPGVLSASIAPASIMSASSTLGSSLGRISSEALFPVDFCWIIFMPIR